MKGPVPGLAHSVQVLMNEMGWLMEGTDVQKRHFIE